MLGLMMLLAGSYSGADTFAGRGGVLTEDIDLEALKDIGIEIVKRDPEVGEAMRRVDFIVSDSFDPLNKSVMLIVVDAEDESIRMAVRDLFSRGGFGFSMRLEQGDVLVLSLAVDLSGETKYYKVEL